MIIHFDPENSKDCEMIRAIWRATQDAPPTQEKSEEPAAGSNVGARSAVEPAEPKKRGRPAADKNDTATEAAAKIAAIDDKREAVAVAKIAEKPVEAAPVEAPVDTKSQPLFSIDEVRAALVGYSKRLGDAGIEKVEAQAKAKKLMLDASKQTDKLSELKTENYGAVIKAANEAKA